MANLFTMKGSKENPMIISDEDMDDKKLETNATTINDDFNDGIHDPSINDFDNKSNNILDYDISEMDTDQQWMTNNDQKIDLTNGMVLF